MALILMAPAELPDGVTALPNPQLGDTETPLGKVLWFKSMNGTRYSTVKSSDYFTLLYTFKLHRLKALELEEFIRSYHSEQIRINDHNNVAWTGVLLNNPFEFTIAEKSAGGGCNRSEYVTVNLEFKAKKT